MDAVEFSRKIVTVEDNIGKAVVGKDQVVELVLTALLAGGHVLLEDVPGVGKTLMAKALARSLNLDFRRIQFTPDLLPADVLGVNIYSQKTGEFVFNPGPIMTNILLADEINRATPRTQSSLLEAMEERQFTVDGVTRRLKEPFLVLATQNPVEMEGTFPLPEAQLDRFLMRVKLGYPHLEEERSILHRFGTGSPLEEIKPVLNAEEILAMREQVKSVNVDESVENYMLTVIRETRNHPAVKLGASPRASLLLYKCAKAFAAVKGRDYVIPDDIKHLAGPVLSHRLILNYESQLKSYRPEDVITDILEKTPVPVE
ncbi:AAA family ATPase [Thermosediminibacter litoriperuensis]|uniref:MoxR-like ATPase n=1 Tax=Thermosediminibacter litoriperuensis TaxID=291989 RepID=A0A5S5ANS9_9FIRM|nr:MoxR family ATPase [Thermosediminibacter litoriperuensis]TYP53279.1 MoxR-like ATPase [Thermosediminibacter litoriperuensis]